MLPNNVNPNQTKLSKTQLVVKKTQIAKSVFAHTAYSLWLKITRTFKEKFIRSPLIHKNPPINKIKSYLSSLAPHAFPNTTVKFANNISQPQLHNCNQREVQQFKPNKPAYNPFSPSRHTDILLMHEFPHGTIEHHPYNIEKLFPKLTFVQLLPNQRQTRKWSWPHTALSTYSIG